MKEEDFFKEYDESQVKEASDLRITGSGDIVVSGSDGEWVISSTSADAANVKKQDGNGNHTTDTVDPDNGVFDVIWFDPYNDDYVDNEGAVEDSSKTTFKGVSYDMNLDVVALDRRIDFRGEITDDDAGTLVLNPYNYKQKTLTLGTGESLALVEPDANYDIQMKSLVGEKGISIESTDEEVTVKTNLVAGDGVDIEEDEDTGALTISSTGGGGTGNPHPFQLYISSVDNTDPENPVNQWQVNGGYVVGHRESSSPVWVSGQSFLTPPSSIYLEVTVGTNAEVSSAVIREGSASGAVRVYNASGCIHKVGIATVSGESVQQQLADHFCVFENKPKDFTMTKADGTLISTNFFTAMNGYDSSQDLWQLEYYVNNNITENFTTGTSSPELNDNTGVNQTYLRTPVAKNGDLTTYGGAYISTIIAKDGEPVTLGVRI